MYIKFGTPPGIDNSCRRTVDNVKIKDSVTFEKYTCETDGEYTECIVTLNPGGGNPLHYHNTFIESFLPISGKLGLQIAERHVVLTEGEAMAVEKKQLHRFYNDSLESIRFRVKLVPGSPEFEKSIYIAYGLANDGLTDAEGVPKNFLHLCIMGVLGDINLAGWAGLFLKPMMLIGAWYARWSGAEDMLLDRYFR